MPLRGTKVPFFSSNFISLQYDFQYLQGILNKLKTN